MFTSQDLAEIAQRLDELESEQLDQAIRAGESQNYDDSGFFSIMVIEEALKVLGLRLMRWQSPAAKAYHDAPENLEGFILNHSLHWYTIRRFSKTDRCYDLDSCKPKPQWISPMYLGLTLREAENQGYSIFVVLPSEDSSIAGLPPCDAADLALTLPPPSSKSDSYSSSSSVATPRFFSGKGNVLGGMTSSSGSGAFNPASQGLGKRRPDDASDDGDDGNGGASSVEDESEKRRRRPRLLSEQGSYTATSTSSSAELGLGGLELSEEDQLNLAISESLRASKLADTPDGEDDDDYVAIIEKSGGTNGNGKGKGKEEVGEGKPAQGRRNHEDEEFEAALKASLEDSQGGQVVEEEEEVEDDTPTLEELRQRRLARFG